MRTTVGVAEAAAGSRSTSSQGGPLHELPHEVEALAVLAPVAQRHDARDGRGARPRAPRRARAGRRSSSTGTTLTATSSPVTRSWARWTTGGRAAADGGAEDVAAEDAAVGCGARGHEWASSTTRAPILARPGRCGGPWYASAHPWPAGMPGRVVELVDTLGSGSSARMSLGVRVPPRPLPPRLLHTVRTALSDHPLRRSRGRVRRRAPRLRCRLRGRPARPPTNRRSAAAGFSRRDRERRGRRRHGEHRRGAAVAPAPLRLERAAPRGRRLRPTSTTTPPRSRRRPARSSSSLPPGGARARRPRPPRRAAAGRLRRRRRRGGAAGAARPPASC